jgi:hypothetical protein
MQLTTTVNALKTALNQLKPLVNAKLLPHQLGHIEKAAALRC